MFFLWVLCVCDYVYDWGEKCVMFLVVLVDVDGCVVCVVDVC